MQFKNIKRSSSMLRLYFKFKTIAPDIGLESGGSRGRRGPRKSDIVGESRGTRAVLRSRVYTRFQYTFQNSYSAFPGRIDRQSNSNECSTNEPLWLETLLSHFQKRKRSLQCGASDGKSRPPTTRYCDGQKTCVHGQRRGARVPR